MIFGIGCDIVDITRFSKFLNDETFIKRIYHATEIIKYEEINNKKIKIAYLAKRFAAKEAFAKALGTGIGQNIKYNQIAILNYNNGKPYIKIDSDILDNLIVHISLSDEKNYAIANIIIEKK